MIRLVLPQPILRGTARVGKTLPCTVAGCTARTFLARPTGADPATFYPTATPCEAHR